MSDSPLIEVRDLTKRYAGPTAVSGMTFSVGRGEVVGLLGPNGAGKTTTMRILSGFMPATSGTARVAGFDVSTESREVRRRIGYMPENNPLHVDMRVRDYLRFRARLKGLARGQVAGRVNTVMEQCGLVDVSRKIVGHLSKGYRQRVGLADSLVHEPELVILDEPTIGLDPHQVIAIRRLLDNLRGETTVLFSSHILSEVEISCDRILILNQGHLVAQGTAEKLREEFLPGSRYQLEAAGEETAIYDTLQDLGNTWEVTIDPLSREGFHKINLLNRENGQEGEVILKKLVSSNRLRIRSFRSVEPSLEDIFLTATRRSWENPPDQQKESPDD